MQQPVGTGAVLSNFRSLEGQIQEFMTLESCMSAGHGHNLGLLGHQVVDSIPLALQEQAVLS